YSPIPMTATPSLQSYSDDCNTGLYSPILMTATPSLQFYSDDCNTVSTVLF
ncbi:UNVERIFIED_CONTAM: hypothetical protein FKN15_076864, partial [Acipenser sinensis]